MNKIWPFELFLKIFHFANLCFGCNTCY